VSGLSILPEKSTHVVSNYYLFIQRPSQTINKIVSLFFLKLLKKKKLSIIFPKINKKRQNILNFFQYNKNVRINSKKNLKKKN
jgi:hypothetical protein